MRRMVDLARETGMWPEHLKTLSEDELAFLRREAEGELAEPGRWGTTFTVIQSWGRRP